MWGTFLSEPLSIVGLVGRYPANCLMERMPIYQRWIFNKYSHAGPLFHGALIHLSMSYSPLIGKLHTRYSPVRRSPAEYCYSPLPLDLHVLSLSLAFILSQDQTLRCSNCFMSLLKIPLFFQVQVFLTVFILNTCTTVVYVNFSKNSFQSFLAKRGAKVRIFIFIFQIFSKVFSIYFFRSLFRNDFRTSAWIFQPHPSVYLFPDSLALFHHVTTASLSIADAKVLLYNI